MRQLQMLRKSPAERVRESESAEHLICNKYSSEGGHSSLDLLNRCRAGENCRKYGHYHEYPSRI